MSSFITVQGVNNGFIAILFVVEEEDIFEPWESYGPFKTRKSAESYAKSWAEAEEIPYV